MTMAAETIFTVEGIRIPDSTLARQITQLVRDTEPALLFHHSSRVYYWAALAGKRREAAEIVGELINLAVRHTRFTLLSRGG